MGSCRYIQTSSSLPSTTKSTSHSRSVLPGCVLHHSSHFCS